jgi:hypothetical protein
MEYWMLAKVVLVKWVFIGWRTLLAKYETRTIAIREVLSLNNSNNDDEI